VGRLWSLPYFFFFFAALSDSSSSVLSINCRSYWRAAFSTLFLVTAKRKYAAWIKPILNFWRVIDGNFMDMAVIDWCKLFGSDHQAHQPAHWKNMVPTSEHDAFRKGLLAELAVTHDVWMAYREELKRYRDTNAAHLDPRPPRLPNYPRFDVALGSSYYYYAWLVRIASRTSVACDFPDLRTYATSFRAKAAKVAKIALDATAGIEEDVW